MFKHTKVSLLISVSVALVACGGDSGLSSEEKLSNRLAANLEAASNGEGLESFLLPDSDDFDNIPQDPNNPLSAEKVLLGQLLYRAREAPLLGHLHPPRRLLQTLDYALCSLECLPLLRFLASSTESQDR